MTTYRFTVTLDERDAIKLRIVAAKSKCTAASWMRQVVEARLTRFNITDPFLLDEGKLVPDNLVEELPF